MKDEWDDKYRVVFFDLDSTVADTRHRWGHIDSVKENKPDLEVEDWIAYSKLCANDLPIFGTVQLMRLLAEMGVLIVILSARMDDAYVETIQWLAKHRIPFHECILKNASEEYMSNDEWKVTRMLDWANDHPNCDIQLMVDDWPQVAQSFLAVGIPTLLVNPGYGVLTPETEEAEAAHEVSGHGQR